MPRAAVNVGPPLLDPSEFDGHLENGDPIDLDDLPEAMIRFEVSGPCQRLNGGISSAEYKLYKRFVCYHSPVFGKAIEQDKLECIQLDDMDPDAFVLFVRWIYTQDIFSGSEEGPSGEELIELWMLANLAQVPALQDRALQLLDILRKSGTPLPVRMFERVWRKTGKGSALRRYIVDVLIEEERVDGVGYPREVLNDLVRALIEKKAEVDGHFVWKRNASALVSSDQMFFPA